MSALAKDLDAVLADHREAYRHELAFRRPALTSELLDVICNDADKCERLLTLVRGSNEPGIRHLMLEAADKFIDDNPGSLEAYVFGLRDDLEFDV